MAVNKTIFHKHRDAQDPRPFRRYLLVLAATVLTAGVAVFALNAAIDPLWYVRGNVITGDNFAFNERFAKLNLFLRSANRHDCLIFGSSRTTLLNQNRIKGFTCANLAFSSGVVSEFVATARYLKAQGVSPKLVIVGVDAFNFWRDMTPVLPDFVVKREMPPPLIPTYLSASTLRFSLRTLAGDSPFIRYYDKNFVGRIGSDAPSYDPPEPTELTAKPWKFKSARKGRYFELRQIFPEARYIGYVPPVSAWQVVEELYLTGHLDEYLQTLESIAEQFDALYDFSIPSEVTMLPENTYDGDHYGAAVNANIANVLQGNSMDFGIEVRKSSHADYARAYNDAVTRFMKGFHATGAGESQ